MVDEVKSEFAQEQVQPTPTEKESIQSRIQNYMVGLTPNQAQAVSAVINNGLSNGLFKVGDLDMLSSISKDIETGLIKYQQSIDTAQRRLNEIAEEELVAKQEELAKRELAQQQKLADERSLRKSTQDKLEQAQVSIAQMEAVLKSHGIHIDLDGDGVVGLKEGQEQRNLTPEELAEVNRLMQESRESVAVSKDNITTAPTKSRAWEMARAMNPEGKPHGFGDSSEDPNFPQEEQLELEIEPVDPIPENPKTVSDFLEEVDNVQELADIADKIVDEEIAHQEKVNGIEEELDEMGIPSPTPEPTGSGLYHHLRKDDEVLPESEEYISGYDANGSPVIEKVDEPISEDEELQEKIEDTKEAFRLYEEDQETQPNFSKPIISGGNAPNLREVLGNGDTTSKEIPTYGSEEELLDAIAEKHANQEPEPEEYEEITIPDRGELEQMTREEILETASELDFDIGDSEDKEDLIDIFESEVNRFIEDLQESGEFVSQTDTSVEDDNSEGSSEFGYPDKD